MNILAIETSCDETAAAVVEDGTKILSGVVASSKDMHEKYGGIVPEVAAREQIKCIIPVITEALSVFRPSNHPAIQPCIQRHIDAIAVTVGPGLIGSLLVGVETSKTIAFVTGKPIIPVNHVLAHMYANFITQNANVKIQNGNNLTIEQYNNRTIEFPAISLVVSGGHTELYLMKSVKDLTWLGGTLDDAAGECFDKTARLLGFGYSGGVAIEREALKFRIQNSEFRIRLPRPMIGDESLNFSFSGLKTAVMREWKKHEELTGSDPLATVASGDRSIEQNETGSDPVRTSFAYEIQEAITDVLVEKTIRAAKQYNARSILLSGGVAANQRLREKFVANLRSNELTKLSLHVPPPSLCTDNAVFIASYAYFRGKPIDWHDIDALPDLSIEE